MRYCTLIFLSTLILITNCYAKPQFDFNLSQTTLKQGNILRLDIICDYPIKNTKIYFTNKSFQSFPRQKNNPKHFFSLIGIARNLKPGKYKLKLKIKLKNNNIYYKTFETKILSANFKHSSIKIKGSKKKILKNKKQLSKESKKLSTSFKKITKIPYFIKPFIFPTKGKISSPFGEYRTYNGKKHTGHHAGIDISNKKNTKIRAANKGIILTCNPYKYNGNTILIDHGFGIISAYTHLNKILVKKGQKVRQGEIIGLMGSTGLSTGSHLHWGISIQNIRVNPMFLLENPLLLRNSPKFHWVIRK
jgi:murein DD-endopeptidase MepM/ murein hydrolase activator NlpD